MRRNERADWQFRKKTHCDCCCCCCCCYSYSNKARPPPARCTPKCHHLKRSGQCPPPSPFFLRSRPTLPTHTCTTIHSFNLIVSLYRWISLEYALGRRTACCTLLLDLLLGGACLTQGQKLTGFEISFRSDANIIFILKTIYCL